MEILQKAAIIAALIATVMTANTEEYQGNKLVIVMDGEKIYPSDEDIIDEKKAGDWVYFRYMLEDEEVSISYPALFRYQEGKRIAEQVDTGRCDTYELLGNYVYYLDSVLAYQSHGILYVSELNGKNKRKLEEELFDFQIVDGKYIYYSYSYDTVGVGLEGHALHRMNLDGSDIMIAAYEVSEASGMGRGHFQYKVVDGWVDCGEFKMELGAPADGYEKIVCKDIGDNDWIYYVTNRLMKARRDGSEQTVLDGVADYWYVINKMEGDWIYYTKEGVEYRIRTDGTGKVRIR